MQAGSLLDPFAVRGDRTAVARFFLAACAAAALLHAGVTMWLRRAGEPEPFLAGLHTAVFILASALHAVAGVAVAVWVHRAYSNLRHLNARMSYSPFMAAAYFVIPGANLLVPHVVLREVWRGCEAPAERTLTRYPERPLNLVTFWWYLFILSLVATEVATALLITGAEVERIGKAMIAASLCAVAAAVAGIDVIRLVDARQALRQSHVARSGGSEAPAGAAQTAAAPPQAQPGWRAALLPMVTAVEAEMELVGREHAEPAPELEVPLNVPAGLEVPKTRAVSVLFAIVAVLCGLQALNTLAWAFTPRYTFRVAWLAAVLPFSVVIYALTVAAAVAFGRWLDRAYANLRAYVPATPRQPYEAVHDFVRRGGDPEVLQELWVITMSTSAELSLALIESWTRTWRTLQVLAVASFAAVLFSPHRFGAFLIALMFLAWARAALLARRICRDTTAAQAERLTLVRSGRRAAAPPSGAPLPQPLP